jgi:hypothetical protein
MSPPRAKVANPNVLLALGCLGGFWYFMHAASKGNSDAQPIWIRWATWW